MEQLRIDFDALGPTTNKALACPHRHYVASIDHVWCDKKGSQLWTGCGLDFFGEWAPCAFEPFDNSPEAMARRVAWFKAHG